MVVSLGRCIVVAGVALASLPFPSGCLLEVGIDEVIVGLLVGVGTLCKLVHVVGGEESRLQWEVF